VDPHSFELSVGQLKRELRHSTADAARIVTAAPSRDARIAAGWVADRGNYREPARKPLAKSWTSVSLANPADGHHLTLRGSNTEHWLDRRTQVDNSGFMELKSVVEALAALAQESRLQVYRLLVEAGPEGLAASELAERLGIPPNTLSFHLKTLSHADLVLARPEGRYIYYSANYAQMNSLLKFMTENCCGGRSCVSAEAVTRTVTRKRRAL
jgi:ArsR family transcriptional regulator, arsenate/arsenite/antimonite-responsive transcriptional repressor